MISSELFVSVIIPFYNAEPYIKKCLNVLHNQDFSKSFEVIMIDDGSTDKSRNIIETYDYPGLQLYTLPKNSGPGAARNVGLKKAKGKYIFLLDVDDAIAPNTLTILYNIANKTDCDLVFSDFKKIENSINLRDNFFNYSEDKTFNNDELMEGMRQQIHFNSFGAHGLFGINGRLIKRSIIMNNNLLFEEKLRYLEDDTFAWDVLSFVRSARYIRKQLYTYNVYSNTISAVVVGLNKGFSILYFKLVNEHVKKSLKQRNFSNRDIEKLKDQALIFYIICTLVSYSRSMYLGKVNFEYGIKCRRKIIDEIIYDPDVKKAIKNYLCLKGENPWIPRAIAWRSPKLLEFACNRRADKLTKRA
jgi:glycosyltransferase involved in cell wall biosynthesis|tara:strand:- start:1003 stop:2079 length:1077 start_codon:yes stop_codon:yes gene_type:complete